MPSDTALILTYWWVYSTKDANNNIVDIIILMCKVINNLNLDIALNKNIIASFEGLLGR